MCALLRWHHVLALPAPIFGTSQWHSVKNEGFWHRTPSAGGVALGTIHRLEVGGEIRVADKLRHGYVSRDVWDRIVEALTRHGVELVPQNGEHGAGARWTLPSDRRGG